LITVIDDICGKGKTSYMINQMKKGIEQGQQYIYVTPFLDEVERIKKVLPCFKEPNRDFNATKKDSLKELMLNGENIVTTHSLFRKIDSDFEKCIKANHYTLVIDEVLDVVTELQIKKDDMTAILEMFATVGKDNRIVWKNPNYDGKFNEYKTYAESNNLYLFRSKTGTPTAFFWEFPKQIFSLFKECYILTYMFDCQILAYYLKSCGIKYKKFSLDNQGNVTSYHFNRLDKTLFHILDEKKFNSVGDDKKALCKSWLNKTAKSNVISNSDVVKAKSYNLKRNGCTSWGKKSILTDDLIWTTYKQFFDNKKVYINSARNAFLSLNARATNKYQDRHYIFYLCNLYFSPILKHYYQQQHIIVNEDDWALSMLIQFVCRSAMRKGEKVFLYIPSKRMRTLFMKYLQ
jgi:hypothetical protein